MRRWTGTIIVAAIVGAVVPSMANAQQPASPAPAEMTVVAASSLKWGDISVPGFPAGLKIAAMMGNPDVTGPYTLRLSFPDGYQFPPHWHPNAENLTVISGTFQLAMGERADNSQLKTYSPGDYLHIPGKHPHFGGVKGATVIQLHGEGPFTINLVEKPSK